MDAIASPEFERGWKADMEVVAHAAFDEINDMSLSSQAKRLRAIEERQFYRAGSTVPQSVDVRVIAAANQDLPELVKKKLFRSDLYHRLNVVNIELPPLRKRH